MKKFKILNSKFKKGFTLIELIVVIAIIGILSTIVMVSFLKSQAKARDSERAADLRQIQTAVESFREVNNNYPGNTLQWYTSFNTIAWAGFGGDLKFVTDMKPYLDPLPQEPKCGRFISRCPSEMGYKYWRVIAPDTKRDEYELDSAMEVRQDLVENDGGVRQGPGESGGRLYGMYELGTRLYLDDCCSNEHKAIRAKYPNVTASELEFLKYCDASRYLDPGTLSCVSQLPR